MGGCFRGKPFAGAFFFWPQVAHGLALSQADERQPGEEDRGRRVCRGSLLPRARASCSKNGKRLDDMLAVNATSRPSG